MTKTALFLALILSSRANAQVDPHLVFDAKKVLAMKSLPEGIAQVKRDDKVIFKGAIKNVKNLKPGDRVLLSKGFHLIPEGEFMLAGETERDDERPVYFEGQGPETIVIEAGFFKEKREPKTAKLLAGGDTSNSFSKMTFVNTAWSSRGDGKRYFTGVRFDDVRFEKGYEHEKISNPNQRASVACFFCVFDQNYPVLSKPMYVDVGSLYFNPEKGYVIRKRLYSGNGDLEEFVDSLAGARRKKGDFSKVSDKEAKDLFLNLGEFAPEKFQKIFQKQSESANAGPNGLIRMADEMGEFTRRYLIQNYKFTVPPNPAVTKAVARAEGMLNGGRPLSAFMSLQQLPKDMEPAMVNRVNALLDNSFRQFTKNYQSCYLFASTIGEENSLNWWERNGKLTEKMHQLMKDRMAEKYPILMMGHPKVCKMEFRFSKNHVEKRADEVERYIVQDQVVDHGAMAAAEQARAAARLQAIQSVATMTRNLGNNIESMARKDIDRRTHFESHVGGKDLVSWKMDRSNKNSVMDGVAFGGPAVPAGAIMKAVDRVMVRTRTITATDLLASVYIQTGGKTNSFPLEHWKAQYLSADCKSKYEVSLNQNVNYGDIITGDRSGTGCVKLEYTTDDLTAYAERAIYPVIDGYAADLVIPTYAKAAERAGKSNKAEDRVEASIMSLLFKADVPEDALAEIEQVTGIKDPKRAVAAVAAGNFERMWTETNASRELNPRDPLWKPEATCGGAARLGKAIEQGTDTYGRYRGACYSLWWQSTLVPYVPAASGSTQFTCAGKPHALEAEASVTVDFDLGGVAVSSVSKINPEKNPPRSLKEWNEEFSDLLIVPFGKDPQGEQFAYATSRDGLVQLELESTKGKSRLKNVSCTICDPRVPMFKAGGKDKKTESYRQACVRLLKMPEVVAAGAAQQ